MIPLHKTKSNLSHKRSLDPSWIPFTVRKWRAIELGSTFYPEPLCVGGSASDHFLISFPLQDTINSVKARLGKSAQIQTVLRAFEARDRNIQESNFERVNVWSVINMFVMVLVSGVQVYLLRSLFDDKRRMRT